MYIYTRNILNFIICHSSRIRFYFWDKFHLILNIEYVRYIKQLSKRQFALLIFLEII